MYVVYLPNMNIVAILYGLKFVEKNNTYIYILYIYTCYTPLKTNMFPEDQWLEDVFPTEIVPF